MVLESKFWISMFVINEMVWNFHFPPEPADHWGMCSPTACLVLSPGSSPRNFKFCSCVHSGQCFSDLGIAIYQFLCIGFNKLLVSSFVHRIIQEKSHMRVAVRCYLEKRWLSKLVLEGEKHWLIIFPWWAGDYTGKVFYETSHREKLLSFYH